MIRFFAKTLAFYLLVTWPAIGADFSFLPAEKGATLPRTTEEQLWGYVDRAGNWKITPRFEYADTFTDNGLARVTIDGKFGFIDKTGAIVIAPIYDGADSFDKNGRSRVRVDSDYGVIDESGQWLLEPTWNIGFTLDDHGVTTSLKDGKIGYIDITGKWLIPPTFKKVRPFNDQLRHDSNLASVQLDDVFGVIDRLGNWVLPPQAFDSFPRIVDRDSIIASFSKTERLIFDKTGKQISDLIFEAAFAGEDGAFAVKQNGKWGVINDAGAWVIEPKYARISGSNRSDLWHATLDGVSWGILRSDGTWQIKPSFAGLGPHTNGHTWASKEGKQGLIDADGNWTFIGPSGVITDPADPYGNVKFAIETDTGDYLLGRMDLDGNVVVPAIYNFVHYVGDDLYSVSFTPFGGFGVHGYLDARQKYKPIGFKVLE